MTKYEILYIIPSQYTETEIDSVRETVAGMIEKGGGKIFHSENLGKIKLAYPIKKMKYGTYILAYFEAETEAIGQIDNLLRLADEVLRHQIILLPEGAEERKFEIDSYVPPITDAPRSETRRPRKPLPPPPPAKTDTAKLSIEELDEKLDKILESEDFAEKV